MAKQKFIVITGQHSQKEGEPPVEKVYEKGDVFESDQPLDKMFVGAIQKYVKALHHPESDIAKNESQPRPPSTPIQPIPSLGGQEADKSSDKDAAEGSNASSETGGEGDEGDAAVSLGQEVTDKFAKAAEVGLAVHYNEAKEYNVVDPADPSKPLNGTPLKNKPDVQQFITDFVEKDK